MYQGRRLTRPLPLFYWIAFLCAITIGYSPEMEQPGRFPMKQIGVTGLVVTILLLSAGCTQYHAQGAGVGGATGGVAGALLDHKNPWRGGVIGAALGGIFGATITDVSMRASQESMSSNRPVEYRTTDGRGVYRADPLPSDDQTRCKKVRERIWENDRLIKDQVREVCEGERYERRY